MTSAIKDNSRNRCSNSQPFFSDFTKAFPFITTSPTDTSRLIAFVTVSNGLRRVATFHANKGQFILLFLLLYLPLGYKFITRDPNRPLARIRDGPFGCGSEHPPLN
jgi:hypothetical protein